MNETFAVKVTEAIRKYPALKFRIQKFNNWKYLAKLNPDIFKIKLNNVMGIVRFTLEKKYYDNGWHSKTVDDMDNKYNTIGEWINSKTY